MTKVTRSLLLMIMLFVVGSVVSPLTASAQRRGRYHHGYRHHHHRSYHHYRGR